MKLMLVSIIVVLAVAAGILLGGVFTEGFFAFTSSSAASGDSAVVQDDAGQVSTPGFKIKMGSRSGGDDGTVDDDSSSLEEPVENETVEEPAAPAVSFTGSTSGRRSSPAPKDTGTTTNNDETPKAKVYVSPESVDTGINSTFTVSVYVDTAEDLYAASVTLSYDGAALKQLSAEEGDFFTLDGSSTFNIIKSGSDYAKYDSTRYQTSSGYSGTGTLFVVEFQAIAAGGSQLTLESVKLVGEEDFKSVEYETAGGSVNVQ